MRLSKITNKDQIKVSEKGEVFFFMGDEKEWHPIDMCSCDPNRTDELVNHIIGNYTVVTSVGFLVNPHKQLKHVVLLMNNKVLEVYQSSKTPDRERLFSHLHLGDSSLRMSFYFIDPFEIFKNKNTGIQ